MAYLRHSIYDEQIKKENALYHYGTKGMKWDSSKRTHRDSDYDANGNLITNVVNTAKNVSSFFKDPIGNIKNSVNTYVNNAKSNAEKNKLMAEIEAKNNLNNLSPSQREAALAKQDKSREIPESQQYKNNKHQMSEEERNKIIQQQKVNKVKNDAKYAINSGIADFKKSGFADRLRSLRDKIGEEATNFGNFIGKKATNLGNSIRDNGIIGTAKSYSSNLKKRGKNAINTLLYGNKSQNTQPSKPSKPSESSESKVEKPLWLKDKERMTGTGPIPTKKNRR